jgi:hypothetical protein
LPDSKLAGLCLPYLLGGPCWPEYGIRETSISAAAIAAAFILEGALDRLRVILG